jgi:hypothetical protein
MSEGTPPLQSAIGNRKSQIENSPRPARDNRRWLDWEIGLLLARLAEAPADGAADFSETARILQRTPDGCRMILSRLLDGLRTCPQTSLANLQSVRRRTAPKLGLRHPAMAAEMHLEQYRHLARRLDGIENLLARLYAALVPTPPAAPGLVKSEIEHRTSEIPLGPAA